MTVARDGLAARVAVVTGAGAYSIAKAGVGPLSKTPAVELAAARRRWSDALVSPDQWKNLFPGGTR